MIAILIGMLISPFALLIVLAVMFPGPVAALAMLPAIFGEMAAHVGFAILLLYFVLCFVDDVMGCRWISAGGRP